MNIKPFRITGRILMLSTLLAAVACSGSPSHFEGGVALESADLATQRSPGLKGEIVDGITTQQEGVSAIQDTTRKLIRDGHINFKTGAIADTHRFIADLILEFKGYASDESEQNYDYRRVQNITVRIPSEKFDAFVDRLTEHAGTLEHKSINTRDVTEEFIDTEARLKTKLELEARYRELLRQAKTVGDMISVEAQLANVRGEIESMQGRLKYLRNQVSFSTLQISYYQVVGTDFGFASKFVEAIRRGWDNLLSFFIGLVNAWPFLILIGGGLWLLARWWKSRRQKVSA
ncbi:MAG: DUF4349 domain-containing protein [Bacteroidota bacterium]